FAAGRDDGTVEVRDAATGRVVREWRADRGPVNGLAFAPDGRLASCGESGRVLVWDVSAGPQVVARTQPPGALWAVAFRPDGKQLATAGADGAVQAWDARTGKELWKSAAAPGSSFFGVAYSPDGTRLAGCGWVGRGEIRIWDVGGRELRA